MLAFFAGERRFSNIMMRFLQIDEMENVIQWLKYFNLSKPYNNINRDFSDAGNKKKKEPNLMLPQKTNRIENCPRSSFVRNSQATLSEIG